MEYTYASIDFIVENIALFCKKLDLYDYLDFLKLKR